MTIKKKKEECKKFFEELSERLKATHCVIKSCNQDESAYLVPKGTEKQITYYGKPMFSFRISDHWNWYSNLKKNPDPNYIQCYNVDMMDCRRRKAPGQASSPIWAWSVSMFGSDNKYHTILGEIWDAENGWSWYDGRERAINGMEDWIDAFKQHYGIQP